MISGRNCEEKSENAFHQKESTPHDRTGPIIVEGSIKR